MLEDRVALYQRVHRHDCATKGCPNYYACHERDCRIDWICPVCEDDQHHEDIQRMEQEMNRHESQ